MGKFKMGFFNKSNNAKKVAADREIISETERAIDALIILAEQIPDCDFVEQFKQLKEKIKWQIPSKEDVIQDYDKKINDLIGELRVELGGDNNQVTVKVNDIVTQIKLIIADRNAKL